MHKTPKARGRNVHGILLLDKPEGITSNQALQQVKRLFQARKAGHTGSLDKQASGLLPLCLGEATKFSGYLLDADKYYRATCALGSTTTTGDAEGEVTSTATVPELKEVHLRPVLAGFLGTIQQVPPMHSALKHKGQRLYKLAYQGIEVEREPRQITIHELDLLGFTASELEISVRCSKGTYIRTLAEDIGKQLGCGAHVKKLRRLGSGPFQSGEMVTIEQLEESFRTGGIDALDRLLVPMDSALTDLPKAQVNSSLGFYLNQGQAVVVPHAPVSGLVRLYDQQEHFMGVGEVLDDGRVSPRRLIRY